MLMAGAGGAGSGAAGSGAAIAASDTLAAHTSQTAGLTRSRLCMHPPSRAAARQIVPVRGKAPRPAL
jgi:hypothetical protein